MCSTTPELQQIIHDNTVSFYTKHHRMVKALAHSPNKSRMVHIVLFITVTWCEVNEPTLKTSLFYLAKKKKKKGTCTCKICDEPCKWFVYQCPLCKFDTHTKCASLPLTIESKIHDHPLTLFNKLITFTCDFCGKEPKTISYLCGMFNCGLCVHRSCASLPPMVKHIRHKHPLSFINTIKADHLGNRLCQLCVKKVGTNYWVYYCSSCDYIAHLDCATEEEGIDETFMQESKD